VTWFDFGGQEVFYPTHELFLTGNCVYLLAFSVRAKVKEKVPLTSKTFSSMIQNTISESRIG
jgi:hypothetical protein